LAINPPSDIVLDVARAADPLRLHEAALKLSGAVDGDGAGFGNLMDGLEAAGNRPTLLSAPGLAGLRTDFGPKGQQVDRDEAISGPAMKPYREFEAFVLQSFIQSMLPTDADGVFGRGTAGEMWKAMLAEQLGKQLARGGGIGIAAKVFKAHPGASGALDAAAAMPPAVEPRVAALAPAWSGAKAADIGAP